MPLPRDLAGRIATGKTLYNEALSSPEDWGLTTAQLAALKASYELTEDKIEGQTSANTAKKKADGEKKAAADDYDDLLRQLLGVVQANPGTTNIMRSLLGLATGEGTEKDPSEFATPPLILVEQAGIHMHLMRGFMNGKKSNSTELPDGADGMEWRVKIGGEPTADLNDYIRLVFDTKSPYIYEHDPADAGKMAHYIVRWGTDDGEHFSPMSVVFSIIIT